MAPPTVELRVVDVRPAVPAGAGVEAGMVVLQETDAPGRMLRLVIGQAEARAIQVSWQGTIPPRPSTWDLFVSTVELLGGQLQETVITAVEEERHFFAAMDLAQGDVVRTIACRPSDALALALRSPGARIMTTEEVMIAAGVLADGSKPGRIDRPIPGTDVAAVDDAALEGSAVDVAAVEGSAVDDAAVVDVGVDVAAADGAVTQEAVTPEGAAPPPPRRAAAVRKALPPRPGQSAT